MDAVNPNHPVLAEMGDHWYKLCALLMFKVGLTEIQITTDDLRAFADSGRANIVYHPHGEVITLRLVSDEEGMRLARKEGGLSV